MFNLDAFIANIKTTRETLNFIRENIFIAQKYFKEYPGFKIKDIYFDLDKNNVIIIFSYSSDCYHEDSFIIPFSECQSHRHMNNFLLDQEIKAQENKAKLIQIRNEEKALLKKLFEKYGPPS